MHVHRVATLLICLIEENGGEKMSALQKWASVDRLPGHRIGPRRAGASPSLGNSRLSCCRPSDPSRSFSRSLPGSFNPGQNALTILSWCRKDPC